MSLGSWLVLFVSSPCGFSLMSVTRSPATPSRASASRPSAAVTVVLGPTNTGKTHLAIDRMTGYASGLIGFPLRLLARENYDRLVARLGYRSVLHLQPQANWQPESAQQTIVAEPATPAASVTSGWLMPTQCITAPPRPIRLLKHPHPIDVIALLPDHSPAQFIWQCRTHKIIKASGPERIAPPWWAAPAGTKSRDYFRVQDHHGACFWLYRDGLPERGEMAAWFLHGFFA